MGGADVDELVNAAGLLAAQDCVALLGAAGARAILVASIGASGLSMGLRPAISSRRRGWRLG